jgi:hypothetical protein
MIKAILRIFVGFIFLLTGIAHFVKTSEMAVYVPVPFGAVQFVYFTGTIIVFASIGIITNKYLLTCLIVLAITMASTALLVQIPVFIREREYILKIIGLSNLVKLGLATVLLLMALYYKKMLVRTHQ